MNHCVQSILVPKHIMNKIKAKQYIKNMGYNSCKVKKHKSYYEFIQYKHNRKNKQFIHDYTKNKDIKFVIEHS